jgi:hypothetical protein
MQFFALPHAAFLDFIARHNADTLLNCLPQAEAVKNQSRGPPDYILVQRKSHPGAQFTLFTTDPSHFRPVLRYRSFGTSDLLYSRPSGKLVTGGLEHLHCMKSIKGAKQGVKKELKTGTFTVAFSWTFFASFFLISSNIACWT